MRFRRWLIALVVFGAACFAGAGRAQAQWGCTISTTPVSFGSYNVFDSVAKASTGSVTYWCSWAWTISIYLGKGTAGTNTPNRQMASGANRLSYNLYLDAAHTQTWGDPSPSSFATNFVWFSGATLTVYGLIPPLQDVAIGSYSDSVTATINF
jgi:spore coat protein U-like protein